MKYRFWNSVLILGVICFPIGAILMLSGDLEPPLLYTLPVLGMVLIGAGASGKRRAS